VSHKRNLRITVALSAAAMAAVLAPSAQAASVCNEAGNAHIGGSYIATGTPDPSTPARHKAGLKTLGNGKGSGLERAAERSPALTQCGLPSTGDGGSTGEDVPTVVTLPPIGDAI
jgi:hypothetical protein